MIALKTLSPDDWRFWREVRLQALAESPEMFGSKLADWQGAGDTEARWRARLTNVPYNAIALLDGVAAGMVGATLPDDRAAVELISIWVAPFARGKRVGDALIQSVITWANDRRALHVELCVVPANRRAIRLCERHGFVFIGKHEDAETGLIENRMGLTL